MSDLSSYINVAANTVSAINNISTDSSVIVGQNILAQGDISAAGNITVDNATIGGNINGAGQLNIDGDSTIGGNLFVTGNINFSGNVTQITGNSGVFYGNVSTGVGAIYAGKQGFTPLPNTVVQITGDDDSYIQVNLQNTNHGNIASMDLIVTADDGTDTTNYIDMGIAGSTWDGTQENSLGDAVAQRDGYIYVQGGAAGGNLVLGTTTAGYGVKFNAGGSGASNTVAEISAQGISTTGYFIGDGGLLSNLQVSGSAPVSTTGNVTGGNLVAAGQVSASGNVTANYFFGNAAFLTGLPATYGNSNVVALMAGFGSNTVSTTGNVTGGNLRTGGLISATGNITGNYIFGNGSQLTGLPATYGNSNVVTLLSGFGSNTISTTGNITAGNIIGNISITGNVTGTSANVQLVAGSYTWTFDNSGNLTLPANGDILLSGTNSTISSAGNITGNYIFGNGSQLTGLPATYGNSNVTTLLAGFGSNTISTTGNITSGNLALTGNLTVNGAPIYGAPASYAKYTRTTTQTGLTTNSVIICNVSESAFGSDIAVDTSTGNVTLTAGRTYRLRGQVGHVLNNGNPSAMSYQWFNVTGNAFVGQPATAVACAGNPYDGFNMGTAEYVFTPGVSTVVQFRVTNATNSSSIGSDTGTGTFQVGAPFIDVEVIGGQAPITGFSTTGNITGGNVLTTGIVSATGNITGNYIFGNGSQLTGLPATYGNSNVTTLLAGFGSNTISTTGNITAGNLIGNISITGNVTGTSPNVTITAGSYVWTFDNSGNLTLPANGDILLSGTNSSVSVTGNITAGNVIATNIGNVASLNLNGNASTVLYGNGTFGGITAGTSLVNGNSNVTVSANANVLISTNGTANVMDIGADGRIRLAGQKQIGGNLAASEGYIQFTTGGLTYFGGNVQFLAGGYMKGPGGTNTLQFNSPENSSLRVFGNLAVGASNTGAIYGGSATLTGNVIGGNVTTSGLISATGNITGGNLILASTGQITSPSGTNGNVTINPDGTGQFVVTAITPAAFGNTLSVAGNVTVSGTGGVSIPNLPGFRVYGNGVTSVSTTTNTNGVLNGNNWAVDYNQGNYLNSATGVFTAPVGGLYQVNLVMRVANNTAATAQAIVIKNRGGASSNQVMWESAANPTINHFGVSTVSKLAAGDTLTLVVAVGALTFDVNDNWSVAFLG